MLTRKTRLCDPLPRAYLGKPQSVAVKNTLRRLRLAFTMYKTLGDEFRRWRIWSSHGSGNRN
jgi:hypothetical protein